MKTDGCAYCCSDLTRVDGLLGPEYFCPACRRFQPRPRPRYKLASTRDTQPAQARDDESTKESR